MISFVVIELILIAISIIVAKKMVDNHKGLAKRCIIGKESESEVEKLKHVAEKILSKEVTDFGLDGMTINVQIKDGNIVETTVQSERTKVMSSKENGTRTFNLAWSKKGAIATIAFTFWGVGFFLHILIGMAYEIYVLSSMIPPQ